jgi:hypothetical protein
MKKQVNIILISTLIAAATPAFAEDDPWGAPEDSDKCVNDHLGESWVTFKNKVPVERDGASADCKAEVAKRATVCLKDPKMEAKLKPTAVNNKPNAILKSGGADGPRLVCADEAFSRISEQHKKWVYEKQFAEKRKADAEKAELPKAAKKDAAFEKAVTATFKKAFPDARFIKVIIVSSDWIVDRNNFGTITGRHLQAAVIDQQKGDDLCEIYSEAWEQEFINGRFQSSVSEGGAGSLERTPIVCSKTK